MLFGNNLIKHIREFRRYVANHKYERTESGLYFPAAKTNFHGYFIHQVNDGPWITDTNTVVLEGRNHFLDVVMLGTSPVTDWYMGLYENDVSPGDGWTAATFDATASENTSQTDGYSGANRITWQGDAVDTDNAEVTNDTTPASFSIVTTGSPIAIYGAFLISTQTRGTFSGTLLSAAKFSSVRNLSNGDTFNIKYKIDAD